MRLFLLIASSMVSLVLSVPGYSNSTIKMDPLDDARALPRWDESWTVSFYHENDLFVRTDRYYTSGSKVSIVSPNLHRTFNDSARLPQWSKPIVRRLPFIHDEAVQKNISFSLGQSIYTPEDIFTTELIPDDRPYAGWLYLGMGFHNRTERWSDTLELSLGVVGPWSLAKHAQRFVHKVRDMEMPEGWHHQIRNELAVNIVWERKVRYLLAGERNGLGLDTIGHFGVALGNVFTYANTGGMLRLGWNLPDDYGTSIIRMAGETNAPVAPEDVRLNGDTGLAWGLHVFAGFDGRLVARDITLDGNTFRDSHSVNREEWVGDFSAGAATLVGRAKLSFALTYRTRTFTGGQDHKFGSINLAWVY